MPEKLKKKNSSPATDRFDDPIISYISAQLREFASGWVIEYHVINPETLQYERHREKFQRMRNKFPSDEEARKAAKKICKERNKQLAAGWSPYMKSGTIRSLTLMEDALNSFLKEKTKELRSDSKRTYVSLVSLFLSWLKKNKLDRVIVKSFTPINADDYLTWQFVDQGKSSRTHNNYMNNLRTVFNWFIQKGYCEKNPFQKIKRKKEEEKKREVIPLEWDKKIMDYFYSNDPRMVLVCMLVYSSFIRPAEMCRIKIKDIHLDKSAIFIPGENAKNAHSRWATLTQDSVEILNELNIKAFNPEFYMISSSLVPGTTKKETRDLDRCWAKMRIGIKLPAVYQLYSYRDTGIMILKESGVPDYLIVKMTGHLELDMLQKYTHAPQEEALRLSSQFLPKLGDRKPINYAEKSAYASAYDK